MKEFLLDAPIPRDFFSSLEQFGQIEALPSLGKGFYKFDKPEWFSIKGFIGDTTVEVRFRREVMDLTADFAYALFSLYDEGDAGLSLLKERETMIDERVRKHLHGS